MVLFFLFDRVCMRLLYYVCLIVYDRMFVSCLTVCVCASYRVYVDRVYASWCVSVVFNNVFLRV